MDIDPVTKAVLQTIKGCGYTVQVSRDGDRYSVEAVAVEGGETFVVRGGDVYLAAVELAQRVGVDMMDG